jgi:hypothetical protein
MDDVGDFLEGRICDEAKMPERRFERSAALVARVLVRGNSLRQATRQKLDST